jgi:hypothetical protein
MPLGQAGKTDWVMWGKPLSHLAGEPVDARSHQYTDEEIRQLREEALAHLRKVTGMDFGYDVDKWRAFIEENYDALWDRLEEITPKTLVIPLNP